MSSEPEWCLIESDPGVFTELLEQIGCTAVELQELWTLDDDYSSWNTSAVYGLIFLFQWKREAQQQHASDASPLRDESIPPGLFFANQVTTNACATQALLSVVMNAEKLELGKVLQDFKEFTAELPPQLKGVSIAGSEDLRKAHNSFARPDILLQDDADTTPKEKGEAFHFVAYVPYQGMVYELDGLLPGPIAVGEIPKTTTGDEGNNTDASPINDGFAWLPVGISAIRERMAKIGEVKFNLMAVVRDKREGVDAATKEHEAAKREQWKLENQRRRHNYMPLIVQLLKEFAAKDMLEGMMEAAKEKRRQKMQNAGSK